MAGGGRDWNEPELCGVALTGQRRIVHFVEEEKMQEGDKASVVFFSERLGLDRPKPFF